MDKREYFILHKNIENTNFKFNTDFDKYSSTNDINKHLENGFYVLVEVDTFKDTKGAVIEVIGCYKTKEEAKEERRKYEK